MTLSEGAFKGIPGKWELARRAGVNPDEYWLVFAVELPSGLFVPQKVLEKVGLLEVESGRAVVHERVLPLLKLLALKQYGPRRARRWYVDYVIDVSTGSAEKVEDEERSRELADKLLKSMKLWDRALETAGGRAVHPPEIKVALTDRKLFASPAGSVEIVERSGYEALAVRGTEYEAPSKLREVAEAVAARHGFVRGRYGGMVYYGSLSSEEKKRILEEIAGEVEAHAREIAEEFTRIAASREEKRRADVEAARRELGLDVPPHLEITGEDVIELVEKGSASRRAREAKAEAKLKEELAKGFKELEAKLKELAGVKEEERAAVTEEPAEKPAQPVPAAPREREEVDVEKVVNEYLAREGLQKVRMIVFDLPSEYKGAKVEVLEDPETGEQVEIRHLGQAAELYRKWRARFYRALHKVAYRTKAGWVVASWARPEDVAELDKYIEALNRLAGTRRLIYVIDVYMPKDYILKELAENIMEVKEKLVAKARERVEEEKEKRSVARALKKLEEELQRYVAEARRLGADVEELVREHREERMEMARRLAGTELEVESPQLLATVHGRKMALGFLARTLGAELPKKLQAYSTSPAIVVLPREVEKLPTELQQQALQLLEQAAVKIKHRGRTVAYALVGEAAITAYQNILRSLRRRKRRAQAQALAQPA